MLAAAVVTSDQVKQQARVLGFDLCGIAPAAAHAELGFLREWLDRGYAGEMHYMHRTADRRADVRHILPSAQSVIVLGTVYNVERPYSTEISDPGRAVIARYAWGDDYHVVIQRRLDDLGAWMRDRCGDRFEGRAYVDTGPVQERVYAQYAGLGWIGKNTCVINPDLGSWAFLAAIICNLPLELDAPALDQCGTCTLCLDACPTGALVEPHVLDSTRCLSYLTIELKGPIPPDYREAIGSHVYGCDICQDVCPWNLGPTTAVSQASAWLPRRELDGVSQLDLWGRSDDELRRVLRGSAMKRAGVTRLRRNLAVTVGNAALPESATALLENHSPTCSDPMVVEHVSWATRKLRSDGDVVRAGESVR